MVLQNEGNFHEGLNFASILDLPVLLYVKITNLLKEQHMTTQVLLKQLQMCCGL